MGRPAKFERQAAVERAMNEIWRNGFQACSAKALSETLGITRSSFYNAFGSREQLFREALALYAERCPDRPLAAGNWNGSVLDLLAGTIHEVCRVRASDSEARGCMAVNSVAELVGVDDVLGPELERAVLGNVEQFEKLMHLASENGELPDEFDARTAALALQNLLLGLNVMAKVIHSEEDLWAAARGTLRGLGLYRD